MGITNLDIIEAAETSFRAKFDEIFVDGVAPGAWSKYTEVIPTDSVLNEVDVLETMPVIRRWVGEKVFQALRASKATARVVPYEKSFEIERLALAGDTLGIIGRRIDRFLGSDGGAIYDGITFAALVANPTCYDGVALFSASHPRGPSGNQSNITTSALSHAVHDSIMTAGGSLRDENGEPLRISYDTMIVGPSNRRLGQEITGSAERVVGIAGDGTQDGGTRVAAATIPNVYGGGEMELVVDPRLVGSHASKVVYVDSKRGAMPIILYEFRKPEPQTQFDMSDEARFLFDKMRGSVECDVVAVAGAWQTAHLISP